jgi:hypothetical protein
MSEPTTMRPPAPPRSAVAAPVRKFLAVNLGDGETLSAADLLRLLDRMRQELSRHLVGIPGAFVGYDSLTVPQRTVAGPGRVIVEARLMGWSEQLHDVEYLAVSVPSGAERPAATDPLLVRGTGRTIHVEC